MDLEKDSGRDLEEIYEVELGGPRLSGEDGSCWEIGSSFSQQNRFPSYLIS